MRLTCVAHDRRSRPALSRSSITRGQASATMRSDIFDRPTLRSRNIDGDLADAEPEEVRAVERFDLERVAPASERIESERLEDRSLRTEESSSAMRSEISLAARSEVRRRVEDGPRPSAT